MSRILRVTTTGLVIDFGNGVSHPMTIYEGYTRHTILHSAGRDFYRGFDKILTEQEYSYSAAAEREIARGVKGNRATFSADYDTVLKSTA